MDGNRGAPLAANADQSVEWGVGGGVPPLVPKVSTRNGGNARGTQAGRVTPWFLVVSSNSHLTKILIPRIFYPAVKSTRTAPPLPPGQPPAQATALDYASCPPVFRAALVNA